MRILRRSRGFKSEGRGNQTSPTKDKAEYKGGGGGHKESGLPVANEGES